MIRVRPYYLYNRRMEFIKSALGNALSALMWGAVASGIAWYSFGLFTDWDYFKTGWFPYYSSTDCNIAVIPVVGEITVFPPTDSSDNDSDGSMPRQPIVDADVVVASLHAAEQDPAIDGVVMTIDSPGGLPVASEIIFDALREMSKPSVALIREIGTSGGYMIALGANTIIASPLSEVGSIGVTSSYIDESKKLQRDGLTFISLSTGKFKDTGHPGKGITDEEKALVQKNLQAYHDYFVDIVAEHRDMPREKVVALADGSSLDGKSALAVGLVDELGNLRTAEKWLEKKLQHEARVCR